MNRFMTFLVSLLVGCSTSTPSSPPTAPEAEAPVPAPPDPMAKVQERLSQPVPKPTTLVESYAATAAELGFGTVRCPSPGMGRARRIYGTPRDMPDIGVAYRLLQSEEPVPWAPSFDEIPIEDGWTVFFAEPGSTNGYIQTYHVIQHMKWPAVKAGETVVCTNVEAVPERTVTGRIETARPAVIGGSCGGEPQPLAKDGTFFLETRPPCTLWILTADAHRSDLLSVNADTDEKLDLGTVPLAPDPHQSSDGKWTKAGRDRIQQLISTLEGEVTSRRTFLATLEEAKLADQAALALWQRGLAQSEREITLLRQSLLLE